MMDPKRLEKIGSTMEPRCKDKLFEMARENYGTKVADTDEPTYTAEDSDT